jgi:hypothetical protein
MGAPKFSSQRVYSTGVLSCAIRERFIMSCYDKACFGAMYVVTNVSEAMISWL